MMFELTDEQKEIRRMAKSFAENEIKPHLTEIEKLPKEEIPWDIVKKGMKLGFFSGYLPKKYGGSLSGLSSVLFLEEIAAVSAGMATVFSATGLGLAPVAVARNKEQMERFFPEIPIAEKKGELCYWCYGLTEPDSGSDAEYTPGAKRAKLLTSVRRQGDKYVINGRKCFITMGHLSKWISVFAALDGAAGIERWTCLAVPTDTQGVHIGRVEDKMGTRTAPAAEIIFEDVAVPIENRIGEEGQGWSINRQCLSLSRPGVAAISLGIAKGAFEIALNYAKDRKQGGKNIIEHQIIQTMLADMYIRIEAARLLTWHAALLNSKVRPVPIKEPAAAKVFASDTAVKVSSDAIQIMGGYGYMKDYGAEQFYRDAKLQQIVEGTNQINRLTIMEGLMEEIGYVASEA